MIYVLWQRWLLSATGEKLEAYSEKKDSTPCGVVERSINHYINSCEVKEVVRKACTDGDKESKICRKIEEYHEHE